jgi:hypothetical protein
MRSRARLMEETQIYVDEASIVSTSSACVASFSSTIPTSTLSNRSTAPVIAGSGDSEPMPQKPSPTFIQSLRFKPVVASLTLLAIPWVGYRYLQQTEESLRQAQEELLLSRAEVVAGLLANHTSELTQAPDKYRTLYVHPLMQPAVADGYAEEWQHLLTQAHRYRASETDPQALQFDLLILRVDECVISRDRLAI